jgi:hypothetical protein
VAAFTVLVNNVNEAKMSKMPQLTAIKFAKENSMISMKMKKDSKKNKKMNQKIKNQLILEH